MRAVNLLTPEMRSAPKGKGASVPSAVQTPGGIGAIAVLGALALCVAGLAGYVLAGNVVKQRKAELAQVTAKADATRAEAAKLKPYTDFEAVAQQRAGTVQALASARFDWEQALRDLSRAVPGEVYLTSIDGTVGGGTAGGGSSLRGSIPSPAMELKGCTESQPAVADLMSRLRNVQGVTRVALSKSDKDGATAAGGSTVNPCGKGAPPSFEMVVFFERSAVAEALAGATGAATSTEGAAPADSGASNAQPSGQSGQSTQSNGQSQGGNQPAGAASNSSPAASTGGAQ
jgi:Tfp pilus assembly protein PilN